MSSPANISEAEVTSNGNSSFYTLQTDGWGDVPFTGKICSVTDACQLPFPALLRDFIELTRLRNCWNWFLLLNTADLILRMQGGLSLRWYKLAQLQWKVSGAEPLHISLGAALKSRSLKWKRKHWEINNKKKFPEWNSSTKVGRGESLGQFKKLRFTHTSNSKLLILLEKCLALETPVHQIAHCSASVPSQKVVLQPSEHAR